MINQKKSAILWAFIAYGLSGLLLFPVVVEGIHQMVGHHKHHHHCDHHHHEGHEDHEGHYHHANHDSYETKALVTLLGEIETDSHICYLCDVMETGVFSLDLITLSSIQQNTADCKIWYATVFDGDTIRFNYSQRGPPVILG